MDKDEFDGVPDDFLDDIDDENLPLEMYDQKRYKEKPPYLEEATIRWIRRFIRESTGQELYFALSTGTSLKKLKEKFPRGELWRLF